MFVASTDTPKLYKAKSALGGSGGVVCRFARTSPMRSGKIYLGRSIKATSWQESPHYEQPVNTKYGLAAHLNADWGRV